MTGKEHRHSFKTYADLKFRFVHDESLRGLDAEAIGEELNLPDKTVRNWGSDLGIKIAPSRKARELAAKKIAMLEGPFIVDGRATASLNCLGRHYGLNGGTVGRILDGAGVQRQAEIIYKTNIDDQPPLPAEAEFLAKHLVAWKRSKELNEVVWPIIAKKRWHDSTHHKG